MKKIISLASIALICLQANANQKLASAFTIEQNSKLENILDFKDTSDFKDATSGFIAPLPPKLSKNGKDIWNIKAYDFIPKEPITSASQAPNTTNPSLFRQSQLVMISGLFKVTDRIYQVRNFDLSNMTIIEGKNGLIIIDPLVSEETAKASLELYYKHAKEKKPVKYVIFSHSHIDHYGGVFGVISKKDIEDEKVEIIAPSGFFEHAISENLFAGAAMGRRAQYMYGDALTPGQNGHIGDGLGLKTSNGTNSIAKPTKLIEHNEQSEILDDLEFVFLLAPNTEAPAEMHWYIPELKALSAAENCTHTMHNLYTLRGAKTRDPLAWSKALDETLQKFGDKAQVLYGMHHWHISGNARIKELLKQTSDLYKYINDQTLNMANKGKTMIEIAEELKLPPQLEKKFALRGYYGSLNHNVKSVYNLYLGWFDGNPANLYTLAPQDAAKKYVQYMGGADNIIKNAKIDFENGEYRWVAQVLNHVVFADPSNKAARELEADALEQLAYQSESAPWRNFYLSGAMDLRSQGATIKEIEKKSARQSKQIQMLPNDMFFEYLAVKLNGEKAFDKHYEMNVVFSDDEVYHLVLNNAVLRAHKTPAPAKNLPTLKGEKLSIFAAFENKLSQKELSKIFFGNLEEFNSFLELFDVFKQDFNIVEP